MTDKQLSKLDRADLLRVMTAQSMEIDALRKAVDARPDKDSIALPDPEELLAEVKRDTEKTMRFRGLTRLIYALIVLFAVLFVTSMFWVPVVKVSGASMSPTINSGDIVLAKPESSYERGDIIAFHFNSGMLIKRVIAVGGDVVEISDDGIVTINKQPLDEPYISELSLGQSDISFPFIVPEDRYFVMGDNRTVSVDSRSSALGTIPHEMIGGKVFMRLWPLGGFGGMK